MDSFTIAYYIFNKGPFVKHIVDCARQYDGIPLIFFFDGCTDDSVQQFVSCRPLLKNCRVFVNDSRDYFETLSNNFLLKKYETDNCVLCQDDMLPRNTNFLDLILKIQSEDLSAGLIGFKDGYEMTLVNKYNDIISAPWSFSKNKRKILGFGEYVRRSFVNRGPLVVNKKVISKIGLFDSSFYPMFWDDNDYCLRAKVSGFNNYVAYSEIDCKPEWGATRGFSKVPCKQIFLANQVRFGLKWNMPLMKLNLGAVIYALAVSAYVKATFRIFRKFNSFDPKEL